MLLLAHNTRFKLIIIILNKVYLIDIQPFKI
jgi:hypothetical protein